MDTVLWARPRPRLSSTLQSPTVESSQPHRSKQPRHRTDLRNRWRFRVLTTNLAHNQEYISISIRVFIIIFFLFSTARSKSELNLLGTDGREWQMTSWQSDTSASRRIIVPPKLLISNIPNRQYLQKPNKKKNEKKINKHI